jgi:acyl-CoA synthetase (AMP-forming)/AMP-acid ligase II
MDAPLPRTIPEAFGLRVRTHAEAVAIVDGDIRLTYAQLSDAVMSAARALGASGVAPGDRVAIWAANSARWIAAALAIYSAGAVLVPLNTRYKGGEAADIVRRSGTQVVFTSDGFLGIEFTQMLRRAGVSEADAEIVGLTEVSRAVRWEVSWPGVLRLAVRPFATAARAWTRTPPRIFSSPPGRPVGRRA